MESKMDPKSLKNALGNQYRKLTKKYINFELHGDPRTLENRAVASTRHQFSQNPFLQNLEKTLVHGTGN